jgi:hypothetical protein
MASKWVVTCDKCGVSDDKPVYRPNDGKIEFFTIGVVYDEGLNISPGSYSSSKVGPEVTWCRQCAEKSGIVPPKEKKSTETTPPPTLEEMIREIVSQEVYQQIQNS